MIVKKPIDQLNEKLDKLQKSIDVELEINANDTHIRWRKKDSNTWQDIIDLNSLRGKDGEEGYTPIKDVDYFDGKDGLSIKGDKGDKGEPGLPGKDGQSIKGERGKPGKDGKDGASVELRRTDTHIQWKRTDEKTWHDLIAIEELQGKDGQIIYGGTGNSGSGSGGGIQSIVAGANITVDNTDPLNPVISSASAVTSVNGQTGVVVLDTDDISDTATNRYTNDTDITRLANTSGTNTGDQTANDILPSQTGNAGEYLTTDGTNVSWAGLNVITTDTRENILTSSPSSDTVAFATDTNEYFIFTGSQWYEASIPMSATSSAPDIGYTQDNDKLGYGDDYIENKRAYNFGIGLYSNNPLEGAISIDHSYSPAKFFVYLNGIWNTLLYDFVNDEDYGLTHVPYLEYRVRARSGDSIEVGLNGQPIVKGYRTDAGVYPARKRIIGSNLGG